jgi:hypothetical protein
VETGSRAFSSTFFFEYYFIDRSNTWSLNGLWEEGGGGDIHDRVAAKELARKGMKRLEAYPRA